VGLRWRGQLLLLLLPLLLPLLCTLGGAERRRCESQP
jgi:hypothetical protein